LNKGSENYESELLLNWDYTKKMNLHLKLDISNLLSAKKSLDAKAPRLFLTFILYFVLLSHGFRKYILQAVTGTS
jgi:hypothetical protein